MDGQLRRVTPLDLDCPIPTNVDPGPPPVLRWAAPTDLYIDESYQRDMRARSLKLIKRIVNGFVYRKLKPPICVEADGKLHCVDGQHTAYAAATLRLPQIPVLIVAAESLEDRADSFVGHNRDRVVMDTLSVYRGLLRAKDPDAMDIASVCERAGVRFRQVQLKAANRPGDTLAISSIGDLITRQGVMKARMVLEALVKGGRAPISRVEISAVEALMLVKRPDLTVDQMAAVIRACGTEGMIRAKVMAAETKRPHKHVLYEVYLEILKKQRWAEHATA